MRRSTFLAIGLAVSLQFTASAVWGASAKLVDSLDGPDFAKTGGLYYKDNSEQKAGTVTFQRNVVHSGAGALKLSVKSACALDDDEDCSERAEIWERTKLRPPYDEGVWYGFAVKFAEPVPQDDHRYLIAQWKREIEPGTEGDFSPFLALRLRNGKLFATIETNYRPGLDGAKMAGAGTCAPYGTPVFLRPDTNQMRALVAADDNWTLADGDYFDGCTDKITVTEHGKLPAPGSGWIDFAILTKPGADGSGHVEIFANGNPIVTVKGMVGHNDKGLGNNQYFKFGPYRAGHATDWAVYYDDFRRSPDCVDVLKGGVCPAAESKLAPK